MELVERIAGRIKHRNSLRTSDLDGGEEGPGLGGLSIGTDFQLFQLKKVGV